MEPLINNHAEVFNLNTLAKYLDCSTQLIRKYVQEGKIPFFKLGNRYYFRKASIDKYLEEEEKNNFFSKEHQEDFQNIIKRLNEEM